MTVRTAVDDISKELPAIRDTVRKVTTVLDTFPRVAGDVTNIHNALSSIASKVATVHDKLPTMAGDIKDIQAGFPSLDIKVTTVHDELPAISGKVTAIHDKLLPAIWDAMQRLTVYSSITEHYGQVLIYFTVKPTGFDVNI